MWFINSGAYFCTSKLRGNNYDECRKIGIIVFGGDWVNEIVETGEISADTVPLFLGFLSTVPISNGDMGTWGNIPCEVSGCGNIEGK